MNLMQLMSVKAQKQQRAARQQCGVAVFLSLTQCALVSGASEVIYTGSGYKSADPIAATHHYFWCRFDKRAENNQRRD